MHPSTILMIVVATSAVVRGHPAANTAASQFWEQTLPGTPMPNSIADLVQKGTDHSPLVEPQHSAASPSSSISACTLFDSTCDAQMVAETGIFFHQAQLHPGNTMTLSFPAEAEPAILPQHIAEKVPFGNIDDVLATFKIPAGSVEAAQVRDTLSRCQAPPIAGEVKSCTTSLEAAVQSAMRMLGAAAGGGEVWAAASEIPRAGLPRQPYSVRAVTPILQAGYASCHTMPFPYAVFHCHHMARPMGYWAYNVSLTGRQEGSNVSLLAFCHLHTANWNPAHPAFEVLHTSPGGSPVCHFMPYANLAFVKLANRA
ncbi:hypothetical protein PR202_gb24184 [Eleusine coracana subsp. coracana]|uniref:BURP domain-containing protein n=1 Tax=Eleusine coracana subsp. coracana TaxID=191504 RepID=A0AAV5FI22_ELECO|nr:hypothetical protein PR202_gb24184 [Eleusine coracana subsp. coracana]